MGVYIYIYIYIRTSSLTFWKPWLDIKNNLENRWLFGDIPNNHTTLVWLEVVMTDSVVDEPQFELMLGLTLVN
jgi:hypothetical protein